MERKVGPILIIALWLAFVGVGTGAAETGSAKIKATVEGSPISGTVTFQDTKGGLKIFAQLTGVPTGEHGFHVHEFGSCEDIGKAAGGHYNPLKRPHGHVVKAGLKKAHVGDFGNITADKDGNATLEAVLPKVTLSGGKYAVAGRAVILHEKADDFTQPLGNAGGRIGCGVILIATGP